MRFDDSLSTVLATDTTTPLATQTAWRQLVDLVGRGRAAPTPQVLDRLRAIRADVPARVRAASAQALTFAAPPAELIRLFLEDDAAIAAPLLRTATLAAEDWTGMLVAMSAQGRAILRHRRDLPPEVVRALSDFGAVDFVLSDDNVSRAPATGGTAVGLDAELPAQTTADEPVPALDPVASTEVPANSSFAAFSTVASALPAVVEAMRRTEAEPPAEADRPAAPLPANDPAHGPFQISDLVARIDAFRRHRNDNAGVRPGAEAGPPPEGAVTPPRGSPAVVRSFQFETDADGIIRWVAGVERAAVIGISIEYGAAGAAVVDGGATGAFRRRGRLDDARLEIAGRSTAAGTWLLSAIPCFDRVSGSFIGYRGTARRPRADEQPHVDMGTVDSLRQLVHELRTPTTAIAGFAEMIESEVLGPVGGVYRGYAATIVEQARALLGAIDDLDMATRIEAHVLDLRPSDVPLAPLLVRIVKDLEPLASLRGAEATLDIGFDVLAKGDDRAIERLLARLIAVLVSAAQRGETIAILATREDGDAVIRFTRPAALAVSQLTSAPLAIDAEEEAAMGAPLLGSGFALRLAMNLARELGGTLTLGEARLTLRLPAAFAGDMGQAVIN